MCICLLRNLVLRLLVLIVQMPNASALGSGRLLTLGWEVPNAATIMDLLSAVKPEAVLFLGKCGGIKIEKTNWAISCYLLLQYGAMELRTIICLRRCLPCRHLVFNARSLRR